MADNSGIHVFGQSCAGGDKIERMCEWTFVRQWFFSRALRRNLILGMQCPQQLFWQICWFVPHGQGEGFTFFPLPKGFCLWRGHVLKGLILRGGAFSRFRRLTSFFFSTIRGGGKR